MPSPKSQSPIPAQPILKSELGDKSVISHPVAKKPTPTVLIPKAEIEMGSTLEFTNDKPIDRCLSPISVLTPVKVAESQSCRVASPDQSKRLDIAKNHKTSAFSNIKTLTKSSRLTKSLGALPELPQSPESPRLSRSNSSTVLSEQLPL